MKTLCIFICLLCAQFVSAQEISGEHKRKAELAISQTIEYLASRQHMGTLGWDDDPEAPAMPAMTGLILQGLMLDPGIDENHPLVIQGTRYILKFVNDDGSIHDGVLPGYNTAICVSALASLKDQRALKASLDGLRYLKSLQYHKGNTANPFNPGFEEAIGIDHPYFGAVGFGEPTPPSLKSLSVFLQTLHDSGVSTNDPAFQRAQVYLSRVQMLDRVNEMPFADGSTQGGFIDAIASDVQSLAHPDGHSQAGEITEIAPDGSEIIRPRASGSMTYAGFKSLIYANIDPDDPRMVGAWEWIKANYTLEENPGLEMQGYYHYLFTMAQALDAWGVDEINGHNWREEMIDKVVELQYTSGSYKVINPRWEENNDMLITVYALIALQHATH
jgi:hypothetical protein